RSSQTLPGRGNRGPGPGRQRSAGVRPGALTDQRGTTNRRRAHASSVGDPLDRDPDGLEPDRPERTEPGAYDVVEQRLGDDQPEIAVARPGEQLAQRRGVEQAADDDRGIPDRPERTGPERAVVQGEAQPQRPAAGGVEVGESRLQLADERPDDLGHVDVGW